MVACVGDIEANIAPTATAAAGEQPSNFRTGMALLPKKQTNRFRRSHPTREHWECSAVLHASKFTPFVMTAGTESFRPHPLKSRIGTSGRSSKGTSTDIEERKRSGWLAVISRDRRSYRALISSNRTLVSAWPLAT